MKPKFKRLWVMSDLHLELSRGWDLPTGDARPDFDVLVVAGDLVTRMERGVKWLLRRVKDRDVIYVAGNHEGYAKRTSQPVQLNIFLSPSWQSIDPKIIFKKGSA
jgi:3',5'-cyclic AMP phosphodiesterase CpdA